MESSRRGTGLKQKMINSVSGPLSLRCLIDNEVDMFCRWLDLGVWRQDLPGVLGVISLETVKMPNGWDEAWWSIA